MGGATRGGFPIPQARPLEERATPVRIEGIDSVVDIASLILVGFAFPLVLALKDDGSVWSWGPDFPTPAPVAGLEDIVAVKSADGHHVALRADGTVWAWGSNYLGALGIGEEDGYREEPQQAPGVDGEVDVAVGDFHMLALRDDGTLWGWGGNADNELNASDLEYATTPIRIQGFEGGTEIAAGSSVSLARLNDGRIMAWGSNRDGVVDAYAFRSDLDDSDRVSGRTIPGSSMDLISPLGPTAVPGFGSTPSPPAGASPTHGYRLRSMAAG